LSSGEVPDSESEQILEALLDVRNDQFERINAGQGGIEFAFETDQMRLNFGMFVLNITHFDF
jgi:hypothetical protein